MKTLTNNNSYTRTRMLLGKAAPTASYARFHEAPRPFFVYKLDQSTTIRQLIKYYFQIVKICAIRDLNCT